MPPMKKAAKKAVKKAAKHRPGKPGEDLRRAYEHTGRVAILESLLPSGAKEHIGGLVALGYAHLQAERNRDAAELLRAAEHLGFAALASSAPETVPVTPELQQAIDEQFEQLR